MNVIGMFIKYISKKRYATYLNLHKHYKIFFGTLNWILIGSLIGINQFQIDNKKISVWKYKSYQVYRAQINNTNSIITFRVFG